MHEGNWDHAALDLVTGTYWCPRNKAWCDRVVTLIKSCNEDPEDRPLESLYRDNTTSMHYNNDVLQDAGAHHTWDEHASIVHEVAEAGQAIHAIRDEEIARTGMDPLALELLPQLALYI